MPSLFETYARNAAEVLSQYEWDQVEKLAVSLLRCWESRNQLFFCGNGGSAANAVHLANDFIYGVTSHIDQSGMRVEALSANTAVMTCLANDIGYEEVYAEQLRAKGQAGDILVVLSGSGNSENVVRALKVGNQLGMSTFAILGYSGGQCRKLAQVAIHFPVDDMQISEDMQLIVGHMCMRYMSMNISPGRHQSSTADDPI
jgi:D-sedoheptulose 7-phosphate isomerase